VKPNGLAYGQVVEVTTLAASEKEATLEANVTGLSLGTTYHFRIEARSTAGESLGNDATFTMQI
jgi:hypothetical protein